MSVNYVNPIGYGVSKSFYCTEIESVSLCHAGNRYTCFCQRCSERSVRPYCYDLYIVAGFFLCDCKPHNRAF